MFIPCILEHFNFSSLQSIYKHQRTNTQTLVDHGINAKSPFSSLSQNYYSFSWMDNELEKQIYLMRVVKCGVKIDMHRTLMVHYYTLVYFINAQSE